MRLGIDARLYFQTGVGVYIRNLLYHLPKFLPKEAKVFVYFLREDERKVGLPKNYKLRFVKGRWHSLAEQSFFLKELLKDKLDLVHFTYFSYPVLYPKNFVITIHDLTPLKFKTGRASTKGRLAYELKHFFYRSVLQAAFKRAAKIIVPSKVVKEELVGVGAKALKIKVVYEGVDRELVLAKEKKVKVEKPFFLYVGNFYPHKNVEFAIEAFLESSFEGKFVLVGPDDFFAKRLKKVFKKYLGRKLVFLHNLERGELKYLYKKAEALVHPSLAEGFGLTLLEALYFGCPVLASELKVFKELYGDAVFYFDPKEKDSIKKAISGVREWANSENWQKEREVVIKKFDFEKTAEETVRIYKKLKTQNHNSKLKT